MNELIAITLLWGFVVVYSVAATIDFGSGFYSMLYKGKGQSRATTIANRYLSPSWKVTNVFIVMIVVALFSFFPGASFALGTVLLIPGSLIVLLLAIRSAFLVFSSSVHPRHQQGLAIISGISGLCIPALLIVVLPITHGRFIGQSANQSYLIAERIFTSASVYSFIVFAVLSTLFLSALLLADYSNVAKSSEAYRLYRKNALITGPFSLLAALAIFGSIRSEASWLYSELVTFKPWLFASLLCFILGYVLLIFMKNRPGRIWKPRLAVIFTIFQYLFASYAYGRAHLPYMIYPHVTIASGFTTPSTFKALFATYIVGFIVLVPGFYLFWRLFMKDRRYIEQED
ncbi:cytochrome d ubiquinol oxidase subunit II [Aureibacillus halotolerans]|uniref:Cytochrome bd-I ubiquinol oxidase subunit 2 apoprotein n=1 Tax=Aureibacillus halotolerans TaxID=1508390 RepID=A0A4R6UBD2_9BACI|nr:cytochrome d ubiquinol oxidase subunit II [Aureibacillus halotolerans]TDQ42055.1 cytochrome bd-I ubiquinol oxidase subunit 2 apoprotein [Aureibacillus halotolerans]